MNKKDYLASTRKLAKITRILCRISIIAAIVGVVILVATNIFAYLITPDNFKPLQDSGKLGFFTNGLYIPADVFTSADALRAFLMKMLAQVSVSVAIFIVVAVHVMGLLRSVENGTPFEAENVTRLRKISIVIIIGSVLIPAVTGFAEVFYSTQSLLEVKSSSGVDVTLLLCGALVLILSGVFAYGARLQREHDQTV